MEQANRLTIAFYWHAPNDALWRSLDDLDPHLGSEFTTSSLHKELHVIGDRAISRHVVMIVVNLDQSLAVAHSLA